MRNGLKQGKLGEIYKTDRRSQRRHSQETSQNRKKSNTGMLRGRKKEARSDLGSTTEAAFSVMGTGRTEEIKNGNRLREN